MAGAEPHSLQPIGSTPPVPVVPWAPLGVFLRVSIWMVVLTVKGSRA